MSLHLLSVCGWASVSAAAAAATPAATPEAAQLTHLACLPVHTLSTCAS